MSLFNELEMLKRGATAMPSGIDALKLLELVDQGPPYDQLFFSFVNDPQWLPVLESKGYFSKLPATKVINGQQQENPHHLPLMALTRMAGTAPSAVTTILLKLSIPDNPNVGDQVLQCMSKIREITCIQQLHPLIEQLGKGSRRSSWLWIQELLKSWLELNAYPEIFAILNAYLNSTIDNSFGKFPDDSGTWLAKQIDEQCLEKLAIEHAFEVAKLIFRALCRWAKREREKYNESEISEDAPTSYFVEDFKSAPLEHRGIEATLARRLFLAAQQIYLQGDPASIDKLDQLLNSNPWQLFRRLRCQLYADFPAVTLARARTEVLRCLPYLNRIDYSCGSHDYEMAQLLIVHSKQYGDAFLSPNEVELFFNSVLSGPIDRDGKLMGGNNDFFYRKQLWPIASLLRGEHLVKYRVLVPDDSKLKIESFKPFSSGGVSGGFVASRAPKEAEAFDSIKDEDLWNFLNTWEPKTGYEYDSEGKLHHENIFAVAAKFAELVAARPERFDPKSKWWENITRVEVLNNLLDNTADRFARMQNDSKPVIEDPTKDEWDIWFGITLWVMAHPWPRHSASRFLRNALKSNCTIPDRHAVALNEALRSLIEEVDPQLLEESNSFGDWLTTAINSARGDAFEALLHLAYRQKKNGKTIDTWIFELIRSRLLNANESPAIFALLGANLRFLVYLFGAEFKQSPELLFPAARQLHQQAALVAHFCYDRPDIYVIMAFPNILSLGLRTLKALPKELTEKDSKHKLHDFGQRLGIQIAFYYWNNAFSSDLKGEAALDVFFANAAPKTRAAVITQIGSIFERSTNEKPSVELFQRAMRIWERRYEQIALNVDCSDDLVDEYDGELFGFTNWLDSECFSFDWRFEYGKNALNLLKRPPEWYSLLKTISKWAESAEHLKPALDLFHAILTKPSENLRWSVQVKEFGPIISKGLSSEDVDMREIAEQCRDELLRLGLFDFLDIGNPNTHA
jgi:hypothetical protein